MARPRNPALAVRIEHIYAQWKSGKSLAWLADKYQRTPQQCGRIIAAFHPDLDDDDDRALHRGRLESLYDEVQAVGKGLMKGNPRCRAFGTCRTDLGSCKDGGGQEEGRKAEEPEQPSISFLPDLHHRDIVKNPGPPVNLGRWCTPPA